MEKETGPICIACEAGDHDEIAALCHTIMRCACACNQTKPIADLKPVETEAVNA